MSISFLKVKINVLINFLILGKDMLHKAFLSLGVEFQLDLLLKIYPTGITDLTFCSKSLISNQTFSVYEFGIKDGSTIKLTIEPFCKDCGTENFLCEYNFCKDHRRPDNCAYCSCNNTGDRLCIHGFCGRCFSTARATVRVFIF